MSKLKCQNYIVKILFCFLLTGLFLQLTTYNLQPVYAQSLSLSISPPLLEMMIQPGKVITYTYKITNNGEATILSLNLKQLSENGIVADPHFTPDSWITLTNRDISWRKPFLLGPGAQKEVKVQFAPPENMEQKDYYRALTVSTIPSESGDNTLSQVSQTMATPLIISATKSGLVIKEAAVASFQLPRFIDSFDHLIANVDIKNTGNTYFRPVGKIVLKGLIGQADYEIAPLAIFTGKTRRLILTSTADQDIRDTTINLSGFFLGKYEMQIDFALDESNNRISAKKTFYAFPYKFTGIVLVIGFILFKMFREKKKK